MNFALHSSYGIITSMQPLIIGVRFAEIGKVYHFDASAIPDIQVGDHVIVETSRGRQLGQVAQLVQSASTPDGKVKPVDRKATPRDLVLRRKWQQKEIEALINCRERLANSKVTTVKIVSAEFSFDGSRLAFMYSSETEEKIDLKFLRQEMGRVYPGTQVDMHQVGPRDVAKLLGGMGACGLETRCCARFLTEFSPISIKMAKEQGISLTPSEITGMCGRLRCCLVYEYEQYVAARKELPKKGKRVVTPLGEGKVVETYPVSMQVSVEIPETGVRMFSREQLEPWDELEALRRKAEKPCGHTGDCTCQQENQPPKPQ